jgi:protein SCO1/2
VPIRLVKIFALVLTAFLVAFAFAWQYGLLDGGGGRPGSSGIARIGGPFQLVDHNGQTRNDSEFRGRLMLIYFGYTFCPDACPTALQVMSVALNQIGDRAKEVQPIFITIDPERDTVARMKDYVRNFHPGLVGLTGTAQQVAKAAKAFRVYYVKAGDAGSKADYLMDHSSIVYLMDRKGRYLTHFTHNNAPEDLVREIRKHL